MIRIETAEDARQFADLTGKSSAEGAALARYAAAMYFHGRGMLLPEILEVYRTCAPLDGEDPLALLEQRGIIRNIMTKRPD